jgi:hypothetical protein
LCFLRPEACLLFLNLANISLKTLEGLEVWCDAFETEKLEPIFAIINGEKAPLKSLTIHLMPSFGGKLSYPVPAYIIPRFAPAGEEDDDEGPSTLRAPSKYLNGEWVDSFPPSGMSKVHGQKASLANIQGLRHLKVIGQPEFSPDFEIAVVLAHLMMCDTASDEGKEVEMSRESGVVGQDFYYEVWISGDGVGEHRERGKGKGKDETEAGCWSYDGVSCHGHSGRVVGCRCRLCKEYGMRRLYGTEWKAWKDPSSYE